MWNAYLNAAARFPFAVEFAHHIGREECRGEKDVAEGRVEPECMHRHGVCVRGVGAYLRLSMATKSLLLASASNSVPGLP